MGLPRAIKTCMLKYAVFKGRASRSEFWWFVAFFITLQALLAIFDALVLGTYVSKETTRVITTPSAITTSSEIRAHDTSVGPRILALVLLLPLISVAVRRLHDAGRSGKLLLLVALPVLLATLQSSLPSDLAASMFKSWLVFPGMLMFMVGFMMLLFWWVQPSKAGASAGDAAPPATRPRGEPSPP